MNDNSGNNTTISSQSFLIHRETDGISLLLSYGIAFISAYLASCLCEQLRLGRVGFIPLSRSQLIYRLLGMTVVLGGVGMWCMYYISLYSIRFHGPHGETVAIQYNRSYGLIALLAQSFFTMSGLSIAYLDPMFPLVQQEIMQQFIGQIIHKMSIKDLKKITTQTILRIISTQSLLYLLLGGLIIGSGITVMQYLALFGIRFQGEIEWRPELIVTSLLIALISSTLSLWILFRLLAIFPSFEWLRIASAAIMAFGIWAGLYTGIASTRFHFHSDASWPPHDKSLTRPGEEFSNIIIATFVILLIFNMASIIFLRYEVHNRGKQLLLADEIVSKSAAKDVAPQLCHSPSQLVSRSKLQQFVEMRRLYCPRAYLAYSSFPASPSSRPQSPQQHSSSSSSAKIVPVTRDEDVETGSAAIESQQLVDATTTKLATTSTFANLEDLKKSSHGCNEEEPGLQTNLE